MGHWEIARKSCVSANADPNDSTVASNVARSFGLEVRVFVFCVDRDFTFWRRGREGVMAVPILSWSGRAGVERDLAA